MKDRSDEKRKEFLKKMTDILNFGALNLAMGIGYRTGLFDVMDGCDSPKTASNIAEKAGLSARYVTEWLGIMVCGDIVQLTENGSKEDLFFLPREQGDLITRRSGNSNLGVYTQEIPLLTACAMEPVVQGFYTGEGVAYENYPKFQSFMSQLADAKHRQVLVGRFLPSVDGGRLFRKMQSGIRVCDLGCGEGLAVTLMAGAFPESEFVGIDISEKAIQRGEMMVRRQGLHNVTFLQTDAATMKDNRGLGESFDYVTAFDAIHDQPRPQEALKGIYAMLRPGGLFSMVDIAASSRLSDNRGHPMGAFLYTVSLMHCMPVALVNGGMGLGMMWGRQKAVEMLHEAGFDKVDVLEVPDDPFNLHFYCRRPF